MRYEQIQLDTKTSAAFLDISDLDIDEKEALRPLLTFTINTYVKLKAVKPDAMFRQPVDNWDITYGSVNLFFNSLNIEDRTKLGKALILMHKDIIDFMTTKELAEINQMTKNLGNILDVLDDEIDLCPKLREFVIENIPVGLFSGAGKRAQDTEALTFYPDEVIDLLTITLLCKMLSPIFGVIMRYIAKRIDSKLKEIQCVTVFNQLMTKRYAKLINKLTNYINHTLHICFQESPTALMNGYNFDSLTHYMYSALMVRQFVNVNLNVPHGNLVTYIIVSVKRAAGTVMSTILKNPTYPRKAMTTKGDDEGNQANIEVDSMVSKKTCDVPIMITCVIPNIVQEYLQFYQIDVDDYKECYNYYCKHPLIPTITNKNINSMFFSKDIGGGCGIKNIGADGYLQLTTLMQMILISLDVNYRELAHMLTAVPSVTTSLETSLEESILILSSGSSYSYKNCKDRFERSAYGARGKEWEKHINTFVDDLRNCKYIYNTAPWIWDWLDEDNMNGKIIRPSIKITEALCDFYDFYATELAGH